MTTLLDHALSLAAHGWPVFPVRQSKRSYVTGGARAATLDPAQLAAWWQSWPAAQVGGDGEWFRWTEAIERVIVGGSSACPCGECSGLTVASHEMVQWVSDWQRVNQQPAPSTRTLNYLHNLYQSAIGGSGGEAIRLFRDNALGICCHGQPSCGPCSAGRLLACDIARWWFMAKGRVRR